MLYIHENDRIRLNRPSVVTIGKFDGFHRGHQKILREAAGLAGDGAQLTVFTFSHSPQLVMAGRTGTGLVTHEEKLALAGNFGVDVFIECPFTAAMRHMSAENFLDRVLLKELGACGIVAGPDCGFGYERRGNAAFLAEEAARRGFELRIVEKERYGGAPISSTRIREALAKGRVEEAEDMLGYAFGYESVIVHGRQLGRTLGFPTINQEIPREKVVPALGVYAAEVFLDGQRFTGVTDVGVKPTVSGGGTTGAETCIFDFHEDVYGCSVRVNLKHFLRPEKRFPSVEELKEQIGRDREEARRYWEEKGR